MKALPEASARCQGLALPVDLSGLQDLSGRSARRRCGCWPVWRWPEVRILSRIDEPILTLTFIPSTAQVLAAQLGDSDEGGRPAGSRPEKQAMWAGLDASARIALEFAAGATACSFLRVLLASLAEECGT
jgi:hypothetical protein